MSVRPESSYPHQFQTWLEELLEQNALYKLAIIDGQARLEKESEDLKLARKVLDGSGINSPMRFSMMERAVESLSLQKTGIKVEDQMIRNKIEPLLEKIMSWFDDIQDDYDKRQLNRMQFVNYLKKYKYLLHQGNRLGLSCYGGPIINKVNDLIESYNII